MKKMKYLFMIVIIIFFGCNTENGNNGNDEKPDNGEQPDTTLYIISRDVAEGGTYSVRVNGFLPTGIIRAMEGDTIRLMATPAGGMEFDKFTVTGVPGLTESVLSVSPLEFKMPKGNITVGVIFVNELPPVYEGPMESKSVLYSKGSKEISQSWETSVGFGDIKMVGENFYEISIQYKTVTDRALNLYICRGRWWPDGMEEWMLVTEGKYSNTAGLWRIHPSEFVEKASFLTK